MTSRNSLRMLLCALAVAAVPLAPPLAEAAGNRYRSIDTASAQEIVDGMANKTVRGAANILTGWVEIPKQIYLETERSGAAKGATVGPLKGLGMAVVRTVAGAGEIATFFLAIPGFYDPWVAPEYVWEKEN
ncbi:MAG TPA: exosortase system-associated protein, TIGR04073 family [Verrucomicrobiae bacterium]|nr:exosortase system-associated protein, TIGR04073 family [Verrucomicrobiae bacterium]